MGGGGGQSMPVRQGAPAQGNVSLPPQGTVELPAATQAINGINSYISSGNPQVASSQPMPQGQMGGYRFGIRGMPQGSYVPNQQVVTQPGAYTGNFDDSLRQQFSGGNASALPTQSFSHPIRTTAAPPQGVMMGPTGLPALPTAKPGSKEWYDQSRAYIVSGQPTTRQQLERQQGKYQHASGMFAKGGIVSLMRNK